MPWRISLAVALALLAGTALAAENEIADYDTCTALVKRDPEAGFESAIAWRDAGGGNAARHCVALALWALGQAKDAADRLEALARDMAEAEPYMRARLLDQAGLARLDGGNARAAAATISAALDLDPDNAELLIDRAEALAAANAYWEAIDDLNRAIDLAPGRADAYAFRAAAYRYVGSLELAIADANRAVALAPSDPSALLERGNVRRLMGDAAGARADWLAVATLAPKTPAAEAARTNLERLDVKVE